VLSAGPRAVRRELDYLRDLGLAEVSDLEDGKLHYCFGFAPKR
jgi:hypothetical protein